MRLPLLLGGVAVLGLGALVLSNKKPSNPMTTGDGSGGSSGPRVLSQAANRAVDNFLVDFIMAGPPGGNDVALVLAGKRPEPGSTTDAAQRLSAMISTIKTAMPGAVFFVPPEVAGYASLGDAATAPATPMVLAADPKNGTVAIQNAVSKGWYRYEPGFPAVA